MNKQTIKHNLTKYDILIIKEVLNDYLNNYDEGAYNKDIKEVLNKIK